MNRLNGALIGAIGASLILVIILMGLLYPIPYEKYEETVVIEQIKYGGDIGKEFMCNSTVMQGWIKVFFDINNIDIGDIVKIYWVKKGFFGLPMSITGWVVDELVLMS